MTSAEIRDKFLKFFESRGHKVIPSASLVPENDPSVLFTTAGMQQFKPYYTGDKDALKDFGSLNTVSVQKCVRTSDIDEVGDESHLTFFEMLGNFSFGGYGRKEAIIYAYDFITKELRLEISFVTFYEGSENVPKDEESKKAWEELGVKNIRESGDDVFWGPTGNSGPCGPTTEIYCKNSEGKDVEIWNIVFNEYFCDGSRDDLNNGKAKLIKLPILGIDTGMGLERLVMIKQKVSTVFETELFDVLIAICSDFFGGQDKKTSRIIVDHIKASVFMVDDGMIPGKDKASYVLRKLIQRVVRNSSMLKDISSEDLVTLLIKNIIEIYKNSQNYIKKDINYINKIILDEVRNTIKRDNLAPEVIKKTIGDYMTKNNITPLRVHDVIPGQKIEVDKPLVSGDVLFNLITTKGIDREMLLSYLSSQNFILLPNAEEDLNNLLKKHQDLSRTSSAGMFKGGLSDAGEETKKLHTATHLLRQALEDVLKTEITQKGSNITSERLRFDFSFIRKLTDEEKKKVEELVNQKIAEKLPVNKIVMKKEEAEKTGAAHIFGDKYGDEVSIYYIGDSLEMAYSKEFCGGPHVENTSELGTFKILKEEAVSAGVRRVKAVLE